MYMFSVAYNFKTHYVKFKKYYHDVWVDIKLGKGPPTPLNPSLKLWQNICRPYF